MSPRIEIDLGGHWWMVMTSGKRYSLIPVPGYTKEEADEDGVRYHPLCAWPAKRTLFNPIEAKDLDDLRRDADTNPLSNSLATCAGTGWLHGGVA